MSLRTFPRSSSMWPEPGTYRPATIDGARSATITCPTCGERGSLHETHQIAASGDVHPSVVCTSEGCTFHEFITLEDWEGTA